MKAVSFQRPAVRRLAPALSVLVASLICSLPAHAQSMTLDLADQGGSTTGRIVQMIVLLTVLSLAPAILITVTSFTRIIIVLSFLRSAMGTQQVPPNTVMISLALFLTAFVMGPTLEASYRDGIAPLIEDRMPQTEALERAVAPFHDFMMNHARPQDLKLFSDIGKIAIPPDPKDMSLRLLIPAFMISELRRAFEIGFLLFLPFVIIDIVVASLLMSMGMMMLPPSAVSLPFKLIFFVLVDGWYLVSGSLVQSFGS